MAAGPSRQFEHAPIILALFGFGRGKRKSERKEKERDFSLVTFCVFVSSVLAEYLSRKRTQKLRGERKRLRDDCEKDCFLTLAASSVKNPRRGLRFLVTECDFSFKRFRNVIWMTKIQFI